MVIKARREDLGFAFEPAEGGAVDYAVAVTFEIGAVGVRLFLVLSAPAVCFCYRVTSKFIRHISSFACRLSQIIKAICEKRFTILQPGQVVLFADIFQQFEKFGHALADYVGIAANGHKIRIAVPSRYQMDV